MYLYISKSGATMEVYVQSKELINIIFGVPSKGSLAPGPSHTVPSERDSPFLEHPFNRQLNSPVYEDTSTFQVPLRRKGSPMERGATIRSPF